MNLPVHDLIIAFAIAFPISCAFAVFLYWLAQKDKKKYFEYKNKIEKDTNPKYANILRWNGKTPAKGEYVVCLDKDNWVIVQWNKELWCQPWMTIFSPPRHEDRNNLIHRQWYNGQMEEVQKVKIEDLPRIS